MQFVFTGARFFYPRDDPEIVPGHEPIPEQVDVWEEYYKNIGGCDENCRESLFLYRKVLILHLVLSLQKMASSVKYISRPDMKDEHQGV